MRKDRLRDTMYQKGHSVESLAELSAISESTIFRILREDGATSDINAAKLATALEVSADYLLGLSDDPTPHVQIGQLSNEEKQIIMKLRRGERLQAIELIAKTP